MEDDEDFYLGNTVIEFDYDEEFSYDGEYGDQERTWLQGMYDKYSEDEN